MAGVRLLSCRPRILYRSVGLPFYGRSRPFANMTKKGKSLCSVTPDRRKLLGTANRDGAKPKATHEIATLSSLAVTMADSIHGSRNAAANDVVAKSDDPSSRLCSYGGIEVRFSPITHPPRATAPSPNVVERQLSGAIPPTPSGAARYVRIANRGASVGKNEPGTPADTGCLVSEPGPVCDRP